MGLPGYCGGNPVTFSQATIGPHTSSSPLTAVVFVVFVIVCYDYDYYERIALGPLLGFQGNMNYDCYCLCSPHTLLRRLELGPRWWWPLYGYNIHEGRTGTGTVRRGPGEVSYDCSPCFLVRSFFFFVEKGGEEEMNLVYYDQRPWSPSSCVIVLSTPTFLSKSCICSCLHPP